MMHFIRAAGLLLVFLFALVSCATVEADDKVRSSGQGFHVGGKTVVVPSPTSDFLEVGEEQRAFMSAFTPDGSRLVAGFVLKGESHDTKVWGAGFVVSRYALVSVLELDEFRPIGAEEFIEGVAQLKREIPAAYSQEVALAEEKLNRSIQSYYESDSKIELGEVIYLGPLFQNEDSFGTGAIMPSFLEGEATVTGSASVIVRVKERLLFLHLFSKYEGAQTTDWLRRVSESWASSLLSLNE